MQNIIQWERAFRGYINSLKEIEAGFTGRNITKRLNANIKQMVEAVGVEEVLAVGVSEKEIKRALR